VTYPSLSGTSVFTDFVELPSQLYEHWQEQPQVLRQFARTIKRRAAAGRSPEAFPRRAQIQPGFATVEFVSSALIDLEFHTQPARRWRMCGRLNAPSWKKSAARGNLATDTPQQFAISFRAITMRPAIRYMWSEVMDATRSALSGSRQHLDPATPSACMTISIRPAARAILRRLYRVPRPRAGAGRAAAPGPWKRRSCLRKVADVSIAMPPLLGLLLLAGAYAFGARTALAHPHVWSGCPARRRVENISSKFQADARGIIPSGA